MSDIVFTRKRNAKAVLSAETRSGLQGLTAKQIEAAALDDKDNPPLDPERLDRMTIAREVRRIREKDGLTQPQFAAEYRVGLSRLRDWEQGRFAPDFPLMVFLQMIADHPEITRKMVEKVAREHLAA